MPMPPSPSVHLLAFLENRYFDEHSTNDLQYDCPEHWLTLVFGLNPGGGLFGTDILLVQCKIDNNYWD